jgi:hypothetical protein
LVTVALGDADPDSVAAEETDLGDNKLQVEPNTF